MYKFVTPEPRAIIERLTERVNSVTLSVDEIEIILTPLYKFAITELYLNDEEITSLTLKESFEILRGTATTENAEMRLKVACIFAQLQKYAAEDAIIRDYLKKAFELAEETRVVIVEDILPELTKVLATRPNGWIVNRLYRSNAMSSAMESLEFVMSVMLNVYQLKK